jgi:quercetin dioxygenase-like cupin family protein
VDGVVVVEPGGGEVIGDAPERRVEILSDDESLNATWTRFGPGREGADLHVHRLHSDLFYVLAGELTLRLGAGGATVVAPPGTLARVPPNVVHGFRNAGDGGLWYLNFHAPGRRFADYLRARRDGRELAYDQYDPPPDGGRSPADAVVVGGGPAADRDGVRVEVLADVHEIAVARASGVPSEPEHAHEGQVESLYVLEGELVLSVGGRKLRGLAGTWLQVPPGLPHAVAAAAPVRYLEVRTPRG